jgi:hypothetical protein
VSRPPNVSLAAALTRRRSPLRTTRSPKKLLGRQVRGVSRATPVQSSKTVPASRRYTYTAPALGPHSVSPLAPTTAIESPIATDTPNEAAWALSGRGNSSI